jgi:hypothetical protein
MDTAVTSVEVTVDSRRKLGRALTLAKKTLDQYNLSDGAVLER